MSPETLGPGNLPGILENPFPFIDQVKIVSLNRDPKAQSELQKLLLDQWPEIDSIILKARQGWTPPPRDWARIVKIPNGVFLTELLFGSPRVKMSFGDNPLIPSFKNIGKHSIKMVFQADSNATNATNLTRNLTAVSIKDKFVDLDDKGKAFLKRVGFEIKTSPFNVQELKTI